MGPPLAPLVVSWNPAGHRRLRRGPGGGWWIFPWQRLLVSVAVVQTSWKQYGVISVDWDKNSDKLWRLEHGKSFCMFLLTPGMNP